MKIDFNIRPFEPQDQDAVRTLYRDTVVANPDLYYRPLSGPQLPDDVASNFSHPNDAFYVATLENKIIGFCGLRTQAEDRSSASIVNGCVVPEFRGSGVYRAMFKLREQNALACGVYTFLAITSKKNTKMCEFLMAQGFLAWLPPEPVPGFLHLRKRST